MAKDPPEGDSGAAARARRTGRRAGAALVLVVAVLFVGSSAAQLVSAVFGLGVRPLPAGPLGSSAYTCATGIRALSGMADRPGQPLPPGREADGPVEQACAASAEGLDAWAALLRLRRAAEELPNAGPPDLNPLRRDLVAHLPADLR